MKELLPGRVQQLLMAIFSDKGHTPSALRRDIVAYGENSAGVNTIPGEIPTNLATYLDKVTRAAYKVTDKNISQLKEAGYAEDEIYEITLSAAVGAGLGRMQRGLMALHGLEQD
jgi:hypothetical protein